MEVIFINLQNQKSIKFISILLFRPEWEKHPTIKPELIVDNLLEAVSLILDSQQRIKN